MGDVLVLCCFYFLKHASFELASMSIIVFFVAISTISILQLVLSEKKSTESCNILVKYNISATFLVL